MSVIRFNKEIIREIEVRIKIPFDDDNYASGEVCFANSNEVRPEFRQNFSALDVQNYIRAVLFNQKKALILPVKIPYPKDVSTFWELVEEGAKLPMNEGVEDNIETEWC